MGSLNKTYTLLKVTSVRRCRSVYLYTAEWKGVRVGEGEVEKTLQSKGTAELPLTLYSPGLEQEHIFELWSLEESASVTAI